MSPMSLKFNQKQSQNLKQLQRLIMSPQMQQALNLMQMPIMELSSAIQEEMDQNPILNESEEKSVEQEKDKMAEQDAPVEEELQFSGDDFEIMKRLDEDFRDHFAQSENFSMKRTQEEEKLKTFLEQSIPEQKTLYEHLMDQAHETFETEKELAMAEVLIGNFDANGFLSVSLDEISLHNDFKVKELESVLKEIQNFDPFGVGATSLQDSFLIQLRRQKLEKTLSYRIVDAHYDDLLHNRMPEIRKHLKCSLDEIKETVDKHISRLDLHPGTAYSNRIVQHIVPDASIEEVDGQLYVEVNQDYIPSLRLNRRYLRMLEDPNLSADTKEFIKNKVVSAKWLIKNIDQRNETLFRLVTQLGKHMKKYFLHPEGKLTPLTMKQVADELDVHESTVARAVSQKYINSPRGVIPLRSLFTKSYTTKSGDSISSSTVKDVLKQLIDEENKKRPLSDEKLSNLLQRRGIPCARRTVAKYRAQMNIGNTTHRKEY